MITGAAGALGSAMAVRLHADGLRVVVGGRRARRRTRGSRRRSTPPASEPVRSPWTSPTTPRWKRWWPTSSPGADTWTCWSTTPAWRSRQVPTWELTLADWHRTIEVDLTGVFHGCRAVLPGDDRAGVGPDRQHQLDRRQGRQYNPVAYAAAKAGVIGLTKAVAHEVAERGILVNAVTPGSIYTRNWAPLSDEAMAEIRGRHP